MLTPREAFKAGFLLRCADLGLDGESVKALTVKAAEAVSKTADLKDLPSNLLNTGLTLSGVAGVGLPIIAGGGLGALAYNATASDVDKDDVRTKELINEYRSFARRAREKQMAKMLGV